MRVIIIFHTGMTPNDALSATTRESPLIALIAEMYPSLTDGHRRVADVILSSPHEAALMRLTDLAEAAGVSQATANRLSTRLGPDGHPELKRRLHSELRHALRSLENFSNVMAEQSRAATRGVSLLTTTPRASVRSRLWRGAGAMAALDTLLRGTANSLGEEAALRRSARLTSLLGASVIAPP